METKTVEAKRLNPLPIFIEDRSYRRTVLTISGNTATMEFNVRNGQRRTLHFLKEPEGITHVWMEIGSKRYETTYTNKSWKIEYLSNETIRRRVIESFLTNQYKYKA